MNDQDMIEYLKRKGYTIQQPTIVNYDVEVRFGGFVGSPTINLTVSAPLGCSADYIKEIITTDDAYKWDLIDELSVESIEDLGDDEWNVEINFGGYVGISEIYDVYADDEDEAEEQAKEEALYDFIVESFTPIDQ